VNLFRRTDPTKANVEDVIRAIVFFGIFGLSAALFFVFLI
jgi:hypothetical protein